VDDKLSFLILAWNLPELLEYSLSSSTFIIDGLLELALVLVCSWLASDSVDKLCMEILNADAPLLVKLDITLKPLRRASLLMASLFLLLNIIGSINQ